MTRDADSTAVSGHRHWLLATAVLLFGLAVTAWFLRNDRRREQEYFEASFNAAAERIHTSLSHRLQTFQAAMRGVQGFLSASADVDHEQFRHYVDSLNMSADLPGVQAIGFARLVRRADLEAHIAQQRRDFLPDYTVTPPGERAAYAPIAYIEPLADNTAALGYDIYDNPEATIALERTLELGAIAITPHTQLIQDESAGRDDTYAFVMYLPVYRLGAPVSTRAEREAAITGWVDVPFRMNDLMEGMRGEFPPQIYLEIHDGTPGAQSLMYRSTHASGQRALDPDYAVAQRTIPVGGREWTLLMNSNADFIGTLGSRNHSVLIAVNGILLSLLLSLGLVLHDVTQRRRHEQRILRLTHLYKALSATSHSILRRTSEADLFPMVCRVAVEYGGMEMAWVGQVQAGGTKVIPLAASGEELEALARLGISVSGDVPAGRGPTGTALRENRTVITENYRNDAESYPWQEMARTHGWNSAGSFPIRRGGKPYATLTVYHALAEAFDAEAIALLEEMTNDIGFVLDNFDLERERKQAELALSENEEKLSAILENVGACIYLKDTEGRYLYANRQLQKLLGVTNVDMLGATCEQFFDPEGLAQIYANDERVLRSGETLQCEETVRIRATGATHTYLSVKLPLRRADGSIYALCGISTDITQHKVKDERIAFLSNYDVLTMLPNRELLRDRARLALATAQKAQGKVALLSIDLDRFKIVNESLGPSVGDELVLEFSQRLSALVQPQHTLCRQGGDDFLLLMPGCGAGGAEQMARRIMEEATKPFMLREQRVVVTACVGIALFPEDAHDFEQLARSADAALFRAKKAGSGNLRFFTRQMHEQASEVLQVESELRQAVELDQLRLHYQPQVDLRTRRIKGAEALVRWEHPARGLLLPGTFIAIAEESGLIVEIGTWVLRTAVRQCKAWEREGLAVSVSVNLSAIQFRQPDFYSTVVGILEKEGLAPQRLELEFTEGIAMENSAYTIDMLTRLHQLGVSLSIDDFGVGYSSLNYLKRYPLNTLKIDQSFVRGLGHHTGDEAIVDAVIALAQSLGFETLAEGVETEAQRAYLEQKGCDAVQGFLFSKAVTADAFATLLRGKA